MPQVGVTGLYYYRARYYEVGTGRFLSDDPIKFSGGINFYKYVSNDPAGQVDPTGLQQRGQPVYNPDKWNDPGHVHTNNCYSYACDRLHPPGPPHAPQPGEASGLPYTGLNCDAIKAAAKADGLKDAAGGPCPCDSHRVLLFIGQHVHPPGMNIDLGADYHWYREDSNGRWSSKHGLTPVGPQIDDPNQDAQSWGYDKPCGAMCAPNQ